MEAIGVTRFWKKQNQNKKHQTKGKKPQQKHKNSTSMDFFFFFTNLMLKSIEKEDGHLAQKYTC